MISELWKYIPGQQPLSLITPARTGRLHFVRLHDVSGEQIGAPDDTLFLQWRPAWALDCEAGRPARSPARPPEDMRRHVPLRGRWSPTFTTNGAHSLPAASYDLDLGPVWAPTAGGLYLCGGTSTGDPADVLYVSLEHRPMGLGEQPPRRTRTLWAAGGTPITAPRGAYAVSVPDDVNVILTYTRGSTRTVDMIGGSPPLPTSGAATVTRRYAGQIVFEIGL